MTEFYMPISWREKVTQIDCWAAPIKTDHRAVVLGLQLKSDVRRSPGRWRLDPTLLKHPSVKPLKDIESAGWIEWKEKASDFLKQAGKNRRRANRGSLLQIRRRRTRLLRRQTKLHTDDLLRKLKYLDVRESALSDYINKEFVYKAQAKNAVLGEKPNRWFFKKMSDYKPSRIETFRKTDDSLTSSAAEALSALSAYWGPMYGQIATSEHSLQSMLDFWGERLSHRAHIALSRPVSRLEVYEAIKKLGFGKAPGFDGLPGEFYRYMLSMVKKGEELNSPIVSMLERECNRIWNGGEPGKEWLRGCLSLLHKKGDVHDCSNYRPLIMLNVDYKIFSGIIATRLSKVLPSVIGPEQGAFLPGRLIDDNIRLVQATINYLEIEQTGGFAPIYRPRKRI